MAEAPLRCGDCGQFIPSNQEAYAYRDEWLWNRSVALDPPEPVVICNRCAAALAPQEGEG